MFGMHKRSDDSLPVAVHVVRSAEAFEAAQKLWDVNARTLYHDQQSGKEVLHFRLANPNTVIWIERDAGRTDVFELVMSWIESKRSVADVFVVLPGPEKVGDDTFARQVFEALRTTPTTVPLASKVQ
jgi:hypothetical protein